MNITNIDFSNGYIYFHCNSVPYTLENMNNAEFFAEIENESVHNSKKVDSSELEHLSIRDYENYIEEYILYMQDDWCKVDESDTDCYLESIDEGFFDSEFCEVYLEDISNPIQYTFLFKTNDLFVLVSIIDKIVSITNSNSMIEYTKLNSEPCNYKTANKVFQKMYRESESYLAVVAKEILIRSHQDYLYSKKQIVVV